MIDADKIDKATRDYIIKNDFFAKYDESPCYDIEFAYKDGANWAINEFFKNLFHPAEDIPEENRPVLIVYKHGGYGIERWEAYNFSGQANSWTFDITQWLYIDDLFPKKKDNQ